MRVLEARSITKGVDNRSERMNPCYNIVYETLQSALLHHRLYNSDLPLPSDVLRDGQHSMGFTSVYFRLVLSGIRACKLYELLGRESNSIINWSDGNPENTLISDHHDRVYIGRRANRLALWKNNAPANLQK